MKILRAKSNGGSRNISFALIVFVGLVIFCFAQLSWWIIFQMDLSGRLYDYRVELLEYRIETAAARVNDDFRRLGVFAEHAFARAAWDSDDMAACITDLLSDPAVTGLSGPFGDDGRLAGHGRVDSAFYYPANSGVTVYFNREYPQDILSSAGELVFDPGPEFNRGDGQQWVRSEMFSIAPELLAELKKDARGKTTMFISEGSFFVLIMLIGAFLIYRTLRKSEELNLRQAGFIQSVTHEFRTPLTSLRLYLETLQSGAVKSDDSRKLYDKMLDDCERLDSMIDNVLEAGHVGRREYEIKLSESDLRHDLAEYLDGLRPYIERLGGSLKTEITASEIRARTDYQALGRAVRALVENAVKYAPPDKRDVTVRLAECDGRAIIAVSDCGPGIPANERDRIFDRFYRINDDRSRRIKGTGLGLHLVQHIVEAHGGTITVDSPGKDQGSTFAVKLPLIRS